MIFVTGSTGLLGSHIVVWLLNSGASVKALYRSEERKEVVYRLLKYYHPDRYDSLVENLHWHRGDILETEDLEDGMQGCTKVVHCAALVSFQKDDFYRLWEMNRTGTANVVNVALASGISYFVHISSTAAVGTDGMQSDGMKRESNHWNANEKVSTYSYTKYSAEKEVWRGIEEGLKTVIVNPSVIFGPGSWEESSLTIFRTLKNGLKYYTKGGNAFVDVRDIADVILRLDKEQIHSERFLITGNNLLFKDLFEQICRQLNVKAPYKLANRLMSSVAWRLSAIVAVFTGKQPTITKDTARSAQEITYYSTEKIRKQFPDFEFRKLEDTIGNTVRGKMN